MGPVWGSPQISGPRPRVEDPPADASLSRLESAAAAGLWKALCRVPIQRTGLPEEALGSGWPRLYGESGHWRVPTHQPGLGIVCLES